MQLLRHISITMLLLILTACGGGDGSLSDGSTPTTPDPVTGSTTIALALSSDNVSAQSPITVTATVTEGKNLVAGKLVTFVVNDPELAVFSPENGAATTNAEGVATITLITGVKAGGGTVTASIDDGETTSAAVGFNSAGDGATGGSSAVSSISLLASSQLMASSGAQKVTLIAIAKDKNNNLLEDVSVGFSSTSGNLQIINNGLTAANGQASAILTTDGNRENRVIDVTATSGSINDIVSVQVIGTTVQITGSSSLALNEKNTFVIKVLDSDSEVIAGANVAISLTNVSTSSVASINLPSAVTTDNSGQARIEVIGTSGGTNAIVATALGATNTAAVSVQADAFKFSSFNNGNGTVISPVTDLANLPDVLLSDSAIIELNWTRNGVAVPDGTKVNFTSTRGTLSASSGVTTNGKVQVVANSAQAGKSIITFTGTDAEVTLTNQVEFEFIAETVDTVVAQASPKSIGPSGQTSNISVVVKDVNGNLVKNKTIDFNLVDTTGGTIFPDSAVTDSSGSASTVYTSSTVSSVDGVAITATVREQPTKSDTVNLTVAGRELFIAIGTGNSLEETDSNTTYTKKFVAFVTDANSNPVSGQTMTVSAVPKSYYKGYWARIYKDAFKNEFQSWVAVGGINSGAPGVQAEDFFAKLRCDNEDLNQDGNLDDGEDTNKNGRLTPGNVIASLMSLTTDGSDVAQVEAITDDEGKLLIDLVYAQSFGHWVDVDLIVSGKVEGTESFAQTTFTLPVIASDILEEDIEPPTASIGTNGPFGAVQSCSNPN